jgi:hypothetical protein
MEMQRYNKLWMALLGSAVIGLNESGIIDAGQSEALVTAGASLLSAFGVYLVPNKPS